MSNLKELIRQANEAAVNKMKNAQPYWVDIKPAHEVLGKIGRASVGKECVRRCRSRWSPYH